MNIAVGITTYNRPEQFRVVANAALEHFDVPIFAYNDGSSQIDEYADIKREFGTQIQLTNASENLGVGKSKNYLLRQMLESGADWLFLLEDDIIVQSRDAIYGYIEGVRRSGWHHLMFAHHGPLNKGLPLSWDWTCGIEYYQHCVGAWTIYTRECLEIGGLMDETFRNAWEHVEHTHRLSKLGYTAPFWNFPDIVGSAELLGEMPYDETPEACLSHEGHQDNVQQGAQYWMQKDPIDCPLIPFATGRLI